MNHSDESRLGSLVLLAAVAVAACTGGVRKSVEADAVPAMAIVPDERTPRALADGQQIFRFETFGDEEFWTDKARMHEVVRDSVSPKLALQVGLKVDADALPAQVAAGILSGAIDLGSPATTVTLLRLNAVLGLKGRVETIDGKDTLVRLGITCALCHSTVDDSFAPGIGHRKDGWPNRDLDVGAIIALSPAIPPEQKAVYRSWGPGKYDPRYNIDGQSTPLVLPPVYGLAAVMNETYTADGPMSYWNAYVAVTQMHGQGNFSDPRLGLDVTHSPDLVTPKLGALRAYQHSLETPIAQPDGVNLAAVERGHMVFNRNCEKCHVGSIGTDNDAGTLHQPSETGMDPRYALRTANKGYRTTPLRGLWQHPPYFHDGSAASLVDVVEHYDTALQMQLDEAQKSDLIEYLNTL